MKLAVFVCQDYYPDGGADDFIGFAPNGTAEEVVALLQWTRTEESGIGSCDVFNLLNCDTGEVMGAGLNYRVYHDLGAPLEINLSRVSSAIADRKKASALNPEFVEALKQIPNVIVIEV